jgi:hypothetical protein
MNYPNGEIQNFVTHCFFDIFVYFVAKKGF